MTGRMSHHDSKQPLILSEHGTVALIALSLAAGTATTSRAACPASPLASRMTR